MFLFRVLFLGSKQFHKCLFLHDMFSTQAYSSCFGMYWLLIYPHIAYGKWLVWLLRPRRDPFGSRDDNLY